MSSELVIVARSESVSDAPGRILVSPWGRVETSKEHYILDAVAADQIIRAFKAQGSLELVG